MANNIISLISQIRSKANKLIIKELEKAGIDGIVPSHGGILHVLAMHESCSMQELAKKINRTKPTVTVLVKKLVAIGLVEKIASPVDARINLIRLSAKGNNLMPEIKKISTTLINTTLKGFSEKEIQEVNSYLTRLADNLS